MKLILQAIKALLRKVENIVMALGKQIDSLNTKVTKVQATAETAQATAENLSDWNALEGEMGHILNRTHYEIPSVETIINGNYIPRKGLGVFFDFAVSFTVEQYDEYELFVNGESWGAPAITEVSTHVNLRFTNPSGDNYIVVIESGYSCTTNLTAGTMYHIKLVRTAYEVKKLSNRFLPDECFNIGYVESVNISNKLSLTNNTTIRNSDNYLVLMNHDYIDNTSQVSMQVGTKTFYFYNTKATTIQSLETGYHFCYVNGTNIYVLT